MDGFETTVRSRHPTATIHRIRADWSSPGAWRASLPALREAAASGPIGVFAISDEMAIGVYRAAADLGMRVGQDVLVVGFDDVRGAKWVQPALTTVRQNTTKAGELLVDTLIKAINKEVVEDYLMPAELIVRRSCGAQ